MVSRTISVNSYLIFPGMIGLAVIASPMVNVLLTDKWVEAVPFIQIFSISMMLWPIHTANLQAMNAIGRSDVFFET